MAERDKQEQTIRQQLRIIFRAIQAHSKSVEKNCGLSSPKIWMLHEISNNSGIKVSQLARVLSVHPSTCSNMLDKLEKKNLVYRDRSKSDQRSVHLYITEQGNELLARAPSPRQGMLSSSLQKLSTNQLSNLEVSLHNLINVLHFDDQKAPMTPINSE